MSNEKFILTTFHSETINSDQNIIYSKIIFEALEEVCQKTHIIITLANADTMGSLFRDTSNDLKNKYPKEIIELRGQGCLQGIIFNSGPDILKKIISIIPSDITRDERFISKLITSSVISNLYTEFNILASLGQNKDICLWISPSLIVTEQEVSYFFDCLDKTLNHGLLKLITIFLKKKFLNKK